MSTLEEVAEDQAQGVPSAAQWLDLHYAGWANKIDLDEFNMEDSRFCVGGHTGVYWMTLTQEWETFGGITDSDVFADYTNEWRREILARQS